MTNERKDIHHPDSQGMYHLRTIHKTRSKLWLKFLFDLKMSLYSSVVRNAKGSWIKYLSFRRKLVIEMKRAPMNRDEFHMTKTRNYKHMNNISKLDSKIIDRILTCLPDRQAEWQKQLCSLSVSSIRRACNNT